MLNIKNPEAHELARELAALENTSLTDAVVRALRAALDEHAARRRRRRHVLEGEIASARQRGLATDADPFDELYDQETGLPR